MRSLEEVSKEVIDLRVRVAHLEGWAEGEADRYHRLETAVTQLDRKVDRSKEELQDQIKQLDQKVERSKEELQGQIRQLDQKVERYKEELQGQIKQLDQKVERSKEELQGQITSLAERTFREFQEIRSLLFQMNTRIDALNARMDRFLWLLLATLLTVLASLVFR